MIIWRGEDLFELGGVRFRLDMRPEHERARSAVNSFTLVKTHNAISLYRSLVESRPRHILEFGLGEGGSSVFFEKLYHAKRVVSVEISRRPTPALDAHLRRGSVINIHRGVAQSDRNSVEQIIKTEFPEGIDLIVDDASHLYDFAKRTFAIAFPHLRPGGAYVLENWAWSHHIGAAPSHPLFETPALTNLIFEFIVSVAGPSAIAKIEIFPELAILTKVSRPAGHEKLPALSVTPARLRGKPLPRI